MVGKRIESNKPRSVNSPSDYCMTTIVLLRTGTNSTRGTIVFMFLCCYWLRALSKISQNNIDSMILQIRFGKDT